jgi:hypothetical protein
MRVNLNVFDDQVNHLAQVFTADSDVANISAVCHSLVPLPACAHHLLEFDVRLVRDCHALVQRGLEEIELMLVVKGSFVAKARRPADELVAIRRLARSGSRPPRTASYGKFSSVSYQHVRLLNTTAASRPANEKTHPVHIDLFSTEAIVHAPNALAQLIQHADGLQWRVAGFHGIFITGCLSGIYGE